MTLQFRQVEGDAIEQLIPTLLQAEESESALRWSIRHLVDTIYRMDDDGQLVGAATVRFNDEPVEIMELAIAPQRHGQGLGRQLLLFLIAEARQRGKQQLLVGTANSGIGQIAFYQKCGLRMDHVRRDYFRYLREPAYENGIRIRDMLVFRCDLQTPSEA